MTSTFTNIAYLLDSPLAFPQLSPGHLSPAAAPSAALLFPRSLKHQTPNTTEVLGSVQLLPG